MDKQERGKENLKIPTCELDSLARLLLPAIQAYFATEEGQADFAAWQEEKRLKLNGKPKD